MRPGHAETAIEVVAAEAEAAGPDETMAAAIAEDPEWSKTPLFHISARRIQRMYSGALGQPTDVGLGILFLKEVCYDRWL